MATDYKKESPGLPRPGQVDRLDIRPGLAAAEVGVDDVIFLNTISHGLLTRQGTMRRKVRVRGEGLAW